jgi:hypothetical protein
MYVETRTACEVLYCILKGRGHVGDLYVGCRRLSERIYGFYCVKMGTGLNCLRIGSTGGLL